MNTFALAVRGFAFLDGHPCVSSPASSSTAAYTVGSASARLLFRWAAAITDRPGGPIFSGDGLRRGVPAQCGTLSDRHTGPPIFGGGRGETETAGDIFNHYCGMPSKALLRAFSFSDEARMKGFCAWGLPHRGHHNALVTRETGEVRDVQGRQAGRHAKSCGVSKCPGIIASQGKSQDSTQGFSFGMPFEWGGLAG